MSNQKPDMTVNVQAVIRGEVESCAACGQQTAHQVALVLPSPVRKARTLAIYRVCDNVDCDADARLA